MKDICIVTTYKREELLYLCLEAIREQFTGPVWVFSDHAYQSAELLRTGTRFGAMTFFVKESNRYGNSANVINSMKTALAGHSEIIHMIEDDTIIHPGYFEWARAKLSLYTAGPRTQNAVLHTYPYAVALGRIPGDAASTWYESPCVSWNAGCLRQCLELIPPGYLEATTREEMQKILDDCPTFKKSKFKFGSAEQDGFFLRCLEYFGWKSAYPDKSFASHMGWWGYNRDTHEGPVGTFEERVEICRRALYDKAFRTAMFGQRITQTEMGGM